MFSPLMKTRLCQNVHFECSLFATDPFRCYTNGLRMVVNNGGRCVDYRYDLDMSWELIDLSLEALESVSKVKRP